MGEILCRAPRCKEGDCECFGMDGLNLKIRLENRVERKLSWTCDSVFLDDSIGCREYSSKSNDIADTDDVVLRQNVELDLTCTARYTMALVIRLSQVMSTMK